MEKLFLIIPIALKITQQKRMDRLSNCHTHVFFMMSRFISALTFRIGSVSPLLMDPILASPR